MMRTLATLVLGVVILAASLAVGGTPPVIARSPCLTPSARGCAQSATAPSPAAGPRLATVGPIPLAAAPKGVAVDAETGTAYVAISGNGTLAVINTASNSVTATVAIGTNPIGVGVDEVTDTIYVANFGSGSISVIDGATNTVTATIPDAGGPDPVGVNPATNRVSYSVTPEVKGRVACV
jgi:YVTN family beta-propeller protein